VSDIAVEKELFFTSKVHYMSKGLLFDLDGTLVNSSAPIERAWVSTAIEAGIPLEKLVGFHGIPAGQTLRTLLSDRSESEINHWINVITQKEIEDTEGIVVNPGAFELFDHLSSIDFPWTIVTSCTRELAVARLSAVDLPIPSNFVTADQVTFGKPHPEPFSLGASRLSLAPENCFAVEDSIAGLTSASSAGCKTIALLLGITDTDVTNFDHGIAHLSEIIDIIQL
jgi:mannitol-1-/sugar-/sorbitol-6-phosphatase